VSVDSDFLQNCAIVNRRPILGKVRFNLSQRVDGLLSIDNIGVQTLTTALFCIRTLKLSVVERATRLKQTPKANCQLRQYAPQVIQYAAPTTVIDGMACTRDRVVVLPVLAV